jgi:hypothetical protein
VSETVTRRIFSYSTYAKAARERRAKARSRALTPPEWCFWLARRKHKAGHYKYDYDEKAQ